MAHTFPLTVHWTGSTADPDYRPDATAASPGKAGLALSSAPAFRGDPARWNPEDLLGTALATCHMLTFLALCAKAKVEVLAYDDQAEAVLDTVDKVTSVTEVRLAPAIRVAAGSDPAQVAELFEKAHKYCFVARSVKCRVLMAPTILGA